MSTPQDAIAGKKPGNPSRTALHLVSPGAETRCSLLYISPGTKSRFPRDVFGQDACMTKCRAVRQSSSSRRNVMAGLYLGIAITGVNALIATALVIAII
jgi:hypothetical protein